MLKTIEASQVSAFRQAVKSAFEAPGHEVLHRALSTPGGYISNAKLIWRPDPGIWAHFDDEEEVDRNRWLFWYGTSVEEEGVTMGPSIEINLALEPANKQTAGRALKDEDTGALFLGHKGGLGGGRGGQMSLDRFAQNIVGFVREPILLGEDREQSVFVIGGLDDLDFLDRLKAYVDECQRLRLLAHSQAREATESASAVDNSAWFVEENGVDGTGGGTAATPEEIRRVHGRVVNALRKILGAGAYNSSHMDTRPDLYTKTPDGGMAVLFEVKASSSTQSWFTALGQLVVYGAGQPNPPVRVLVCPASLKSPNFLRALEHLDVKLVFFDEAADKAVTFRGLEPFMRGS